MGLIQALLHFQNNPMLHLRILFLSNFAWQNSCRIVALFFHKWISRHSDKKCVGYCSFWPRIEQKCIFLRKQKSRKYVQLRIYGFFRCVFLPFWKVANKWFYHCKHRLHKLKMCTLKEYEKAWYIAVLWYIRFLFSKKLGSQHENDVLWSILTSEKQFSLYEKNWKFKKMEFYNGNGISENSFSITKRMYMLALFDRLWYNYSK